MEQSYVRYLMDLLQTCKWRKLKLVVHVVLLEFAGFPALSSLELVYDSYIQEVRAKKGQRIEVQANLEEKGYKAEVQSRE